MYKLKKSDPRFISAYDGLHRLLHSTGVCDSDGCIVMVFSQHYGTLYLHFATRSHVLATSKATQVREALYKLGIYTWISFEGNTQFTLNTSYAALERLVEFGEMSDEEFERVRHFSAL